MTEPVANPSKSDSIRSIFFGNYIECYAMGLTGRREEGGATSLITSVVSHVQSRVTNPSDRPRMARLQSGRDTVTRYDISYYTSLLLHV